MITQQMEPVEDGTPILPVVQPQEIIVPLRMTGAMHAYESGDQRGFRGNKLGKNQHTDEAGCYPYQMRTLYLWRIAVEAVTARHGFDTEGYHGECDALWEAIPHGADWGDEVYHATFAVYAQKVIGGVQ